VSLSRRPENAGRRDRPGKDDCGPAASSTSQAFIEQRSADSVGRSRSTSKEGIGRKRNREIFSTGKIYGRRRYFRQTAAAPHGFFRESGAFLFGAGVNPSTHAHPPPARGRSGFEKACRLIQGGVSAGGCRRKFPPTDLRADWGQARCSRVAGRTGSGVVSRQPPSDGPLL